MSEIESLFMLLDCYQGGGKVYLMRGLDSGKKDYLDLITIGRCFARLGRNVKVLAPVHFKDATYKDVYGDLIGTRYYRKCPDLLVDGCYYEYESYLRPWNKRKLSNMIVDGLKQSNRIILDNRDGASLRFIERAVLSRIAINAPISEVWMYDGDSVIDLMIEGKIVK